MERKTIGKYYSDKNLAYLYDINQNSSLPSLLSSVILNKIFYFPCSTSSASGDLVMLIWGN